VDYRSPGTPRAVRIGADGGRVVFLRAAGAGQPVERLFVLDVATGDERLIADPATLGGEGAIDSYAIDPAARVAAFPLDGRLFRADLGSGEVIEVPTAGPVTDPRPDPTCRRLAYVCGATLHTIDSDGADTLLAGEDGQVTWGRVDPAAATEFGRRRGFWWAPDGESILAARVDPSPLPRSPTAEVTLHLLDLDGGWVDVHWDRETYPYLAAVHWSEGAPLITVLRRLQQHGLVLAIEPRTGETQVHAELADPRWVEPIAGTPCHLADGRVLVGGELAHDGYDARCLFADGTLLTPPSLYVRRVVGLLRCGGVAPDLLVEASDGEPSEQHLYRVRTAIGCSGVDTQRLTTEPGWHVGATGGDVLLIGSASLDHDGTQWTIWRGGTRIGEIGARATASAHTPHPALERVTDRRVPAGVLYPRHHVAGRRLPVLVCGYGGPGRQEVLATRAAWLDRQWWADAGFAVVVVDNRGTPGVAPSFEKVIHRRLADVILADQIDALTALADKHPDLDLHRVAIRGRSFGGWLAGLGVLRRPDVYRCGIAEDAITDWTLYDPAYAERYLGLPDDGTDVYAHHSLIEAAAERPVRPDDARPLLLVHRPVEQTPVAAHTLRLSAALLRSGRPHAVLPLPNGAELPTAVRAVELDFLRRHLPQT
jgi:dipeptidyl-peptidase-4